MTTSKRSYVGGGGQSLSQAQETGSRKMTVQQQHASAEMFHSMGTEQYQQKLLAAGEDAQLKTSQMLTADLGPLDVSGGFQKDNRGLRKQDRSKQVLNLNKKLIKPLTGNKAHGNNASQSNLAFPGSNINPLQLAGASDAVLADSSRPMDPRPGSSDKVNSLNFLTTGSQQHQSQKIRIPQHAQHALANVNKRNPVDISQKGSFVSQRSGNNTNNKSISQQKHAKKNNQQLQQLHGHAPSNSHSSRFASTSHAAVNSNSLNPINAVQLGLNQKLKGAANRDNMTNQERRPQLSAITKPRFNSNRYDDPTQGHNGNATEPTLQSSKHAVPNPNMYKNMTLNHNSEKKFINSERVPGDIDATPDPTTDAFANSNGQKFVDGRSQSRAIASQSIPTGSSNTMNNVSGNHHMHHPGQQIPAQQQRAHVLKQSKSNISSKTIGLMQQRLMQTANNDTATENLLKQAHYITSQKAGTGSQHQKIHAVKVNPLLQNNGEHNNGITPIFNLPPMQGREPQSKQYMRQRGASQSNANVLNSKHMSDSTQLTPQNASEDPKQQKRASHKPRVNNKGDILSPDAVQMNPFNIDGTSTLNLHNKKHDADKTQKLHDKSPLGQFQSTPNSNNTTNLILGASQDNIGHKEGGIIPAGPNHTYRSENAKNSDVLTSASGDNTGATTNKIQKKLNSLLSQAQSAQDDGSHVGKPPQKRTPQQTQSNKHPKPAQTSNMGNHSGNNFTAATGHIHQTDNFFQQQQQQPPQFKATTQTQQLQGQQIVMPQHQDAERERNDTIPEEPTISMDEFQSNQASFCANPIVDPNSGYNSGAIQNSSQAGSKNATSKIPRNGKKQYMDSESAQRNIDGDKDMKKKPEEPAGPASIKSLNRRREHKLLQSQNLLTTKNSSVAGVLDASTPSNQLMQSLSSDKLAQKQSHQQNPFKQTLEPTHASPIQKNNNRQLQHHSNQPSSAEQSGSKQGKVQLSSSAQVGRNEGDKINKIDSPNDDLDEDKDFEDCDKEGHGVPDENNNLALVKGLNPKSQLHNSIVQRANRNQQLGQQQNAPYNNSAPNPDVQKPPSGQQHSHSNSQVRTQQQPQQQQQQTQQPHPPQQQIQQQQSIRKVDDQVAQFAYLTRPGKTADGVSKTNQDNFFVVKNFAKIENLWYFGVCDGHGQNGHYVSEYVKNKLALDIMEVDISHKEQVAMKVAKNKVFGSYDQNGSFDSEQLQKTGDLFYKRKQSHDHNQQQDTFNEGMQGSANRSLNKKRKSQDERAAELGKLKQQIMKSITSNLLQDGPKMLKVFTEGFKKNDNGLRHQGFGFEFSGTTIVTAMVQGNRIVTANAGDSRAVIGSLKSNTYQIQDSEIEGKALSLENNDMAWFTKQITRDHKPDDPDEMARILSMNGRIESYKGRYGENVGPARVWLKNEQYPGLAMSRSIGDACAHSVGVSSLPEIKEFMTNDDDKFMILASDGVWEFLSNEEVIDLIVPFWHRNDLKGACSTVVRESVNAWEREEDSIDDITCIIVFFKRSGPITDYSQVRTEVSQPRRQAREGGSHTRDPSQNKQQAQNNNSNNQGGGDGHQAKGNQYQHKGRHLKKSKDTTNQSSKK